MIMVMFEKTFNVGYPPTDFTKYGGMGKYKIYQTVFDSPPAPLPSLSDTSVVDLEVVLGKKAPFPEFTWHPEIIQETKTFVLDPTSSFDIDGTVERFDWKITSPTGVVDNFNEELPKITNAIEKVLTTLSFMYGIMIIYRSNSQLYMISWWIHYQLISRQWLCFIGIRTNHSWGRT